jgi:UDP-N-acetylglucosamine 2-epimerase (non-hydrolysing)
MTLLGTRPEIIRLSRVIAALERTVDHVLVHTGQNYDYELNEVFFKDLELRAPDMFLGIGTDSLGQSLGDVLKGTEAALEKYRPEAFLVLGDTNSCLGAIMARRLAVPVFHMEAGNRCFDLNVPEETNRRIIDHVADINLAYTEHARRNLLAEGLHPRRVYVTGSPMQEVLTYFRPRIDASQALDDLHLQRRGYFLVSLHRQENVDSPAQLRELVEMLEILHERHRLPVVVSTHPRTRRRLEDAGITTERAGIRFLAPFGFHDYNKLQIEARCVLSDSGTISEESAILGFPAITVRNAIERPEALDAGTLILASTTTDAVLQAVEITLDQWDSGKVPPVPEDYQVTDTSRRVLNVIAGLAGLHHRWAGITPVAGIVRADPGTKS